ncbi:hypothetical protein OG912_05605 [Streptomyces sp. NBC_00464]
MLEHVRNQPALDVRAPLVLQRSGNDRAQLHDVPEEHGRLLGVGDGEQDLGQGGGADLVDEDHVVVTGEDMPVGTEAGQGRGDEAGVLDDLALRVTGEALVLLLDLLVPLLQRALPSRFGGDDGTQNLGLPLPGGPALFLGGGDERLGEVRAPGFVLGRGESRTKFAQRPGLGAVAGGGGARRLVTSVDLGVGEGDRPSHLLGLDRDPGPAAIRDVAGLEGMVVRLPELDSRLTARGLGAGSLSS